MGREFEQKYAATEKILSDLATKYPGGRRISMHTTYYDTPDNDLSQGKMTLRIRKENDLSVCTLKTPLPDGSRSEWECPATDIAAGIRSLLDLGAPSQLEALTAKGLDVVCGARFTRLAIDVATADGIAELALDSGVLMGGGKEIPLCEVEVELKSGSESAAVALAQQLASTYGLKSEPKSKFRRAMDLVTGE